MKQLKQKPFFVVLLVLFFATHGAVDNFGFIYFSEVIKISLTILAAVLLFFVLMKWMVKDAVHAGLIVFFISAWILFFGAALDAVRSVRFLKLLHSYSVFVPFMLLTLVLFVFLIRKKKSWFSGLCYYLNVLLLLYCVYDISVLTIKWMNSKSVAVKNTAFNATVVKEKPNVYLLLFDGYPGYRSLKDSFAFDNDSLYHFLQSEHFIAQPTFSNYNMTYYSMSSMLNMKYIDEPFVALENTAANDQQRIKEIRNAMVVQCFKQMGYRFVNYSIFDIADEPSVKGNSFVVSQATLLTNKIFFNKLIKDIGWHFISGKYKIGFLENVYRGDERNNHFIVEQLLHDSTDTAPGFVYAHLLLPHPPFFNDSLGNALPAEKVFDPGLGANKAFFLSYLKYTNHIMQNVVHSICSRDSNAIVIVMSDHGYRDYQTGNRTEPLQFNNICFTRFPNGKYDSVRAAWSNVNLFPFIFNSQFNQQIPYLADSSIFLRDKKIAE
ncbi:MAG: sulfatase-like hydrolase/transferase [Bacteroidetes bacterium]|nr:sulfatase-like hydrolase/transferase [Bacteroidota bacterium]